MKTNIIKSKRVHNAFYINGQGFLLDNWSFHKKGNRFTEQEKQDFDEYIRNNL